MNKVVVSDHAARKYKINECLLKAPLGEHRADLRFLPKYMGIALNTFHNYRYILLNDNQDIPQEKVVLLEKLFELKPGELHNKMIRALPLGELIKDN